MRQAHGASASAAAHASGTSLTPRGPRPVEGFMSPMFNVNQRSPGAGVQFGSVTILHPGQVKVFAGEPDPQRRFSLAALFSILPRLTGASVLSRRGGDRCLPFRLFRSWSLPALWHGLAHQRRTGVCQAIGQSAVAVGERRVAVFTDTQNALVRSVQPSHAERTALLAVSTPTTLTQVALTD
jgi:hypothetical protein